MPIPREEAANALHDIEHAQRSSAGAYRDRRFSPHLFLWGLIWVVGYAVNYFWPKGSLIWIALVLIGMIGSLWLGSRDAGGQRSGAHSGWQYGGTALAVFLFINAWLAILPARSGEQIGALIPILVAFIYALVGVWTRGARIALLGLALAALTVGGYFWLPQYFLLWMAGVGGGALILGGFWLRTV
jgi:hypothetical protein